MEISEIYNQYINFEKENSLANKFPEIAKQWNYEKNLSLTPEMISPYSNKKVWWKCQEGHEWRAVVCSRVAGNGCPYCSEQKVLTGYIGMWGRIHKRYLMEHRKVLFTHLAMGNELHTYLADIDEQASEMFDSIVRDIKKAEGVTEQLKAANQWEWIRRMENIQNRAREVVKNELIYA